MKSFKTAVTGIVIFSMGFLSCSKNKNEITTGSKSGIVVDYSTRQPLSGVKVYLFASTNMNYIHPHLWEFSQADTVTTSYVPNAVAALDSTLTNTGGRFEFTNITNLPQPASHFTSLSRNDTRIHIQNVFWRTSVYDTMYTDNKSILRLDIRHSNAVASDTLLQRLLFIGEPPTLNSNISNDLYFKAQVGRTSSLITQPFSHTAYKKVIVEYRRYNNGLQSAAKDTFNLQYGQNAFDIVY